MVPCEAVVRFDKAAARPAPPPMTSADGPTSPTLRGQYAGVHAMARRAFGDFGDSLAATCGR